jgi:hypothetical protein
VEGGRDTKSILESFPSQEHETCYVLPLFATRGGMNRIGEEKKLYHKFYAVCADIIIQYETLCLLAIKIQRYENSHMPFFALSSSRRRRRIYMSKSRPCE